LSNKTLKTFKQVFFLNTVHLSELPDCSQVSGYQYKQFLNHIFIICVKSDFYVGGIA